MISLDQALAERRAAHLYRVRRTLSGPQGVEVRVDGRSMLAFCSNDYLGLAADARVVAALREGASLWGVGSGAAHLVSGHMAPHQALEEELADFLRRPRALLFSTGYMANLGLISALVRAGDQVWEDRLNHASLIDGGLLSRARLRRYPHADPAALAARLDPLPEGRRRLIVTDGVFSMDGDLAPLPALADLARARGAWLMVDDAHGLGVLGDEGRGTLAHHGLGMEAVPLLVGTLGKAFGTFGAFVAGSASLIETLIQQARGYIYTTALPPALAEATRVSLRLVRDEPWRRQGLHALVARFRAGAKALDLPLGDSPTPIQPILAGTAQRALAWSQALERAGILVTAIRPPTVPEGSARLRVTLSAAHTEAQVDRLLETLAQVVRDEAAP